MKSIRHESTEQQQHLFSIAAIMAHKSSVLGQQQQQKQLQINGKTNCDFQATLHVRLGTSFWYFWDTFSGPNEPEQSDTTRIGPHF